MQNNLLNKLHEMGYGFREWKIDKEQYLAILEVFEHYQIPFVLEDFEDLFYYKDLNKDIKWVDGLPKNGVPQMRGEIYPDEDASIIRNFHIYDLKNRSNYYYCWWYDFSQISPRKYAFHENIDASDDRLVVHKMIVINPRFNIINSGERYSPEPYNFHGFLLENNKLLYRKTFTLDLYYDEIECHDLFTNEDMKYDKSCSCSLYHFPTNEYFQTPYFGIMPIYQDISRNDVVELFDLPTFLPKIDGISNSEMPINII